MRKVLVLASSVADASGGSLRAAVNIAEALAADGVSVMLSAPVAPRTSTQTVEQMDERVSVRLFPASRPAARFGGSIRQLAWLLRNAADFDVVQVHSVFSLSAVYSILVCAARGVPILLWPHGSIDPFDLRKHERIKRVLAPALRRLFDRCQALVFTTDHEGEVAVTYGSTVRRVVVPLPVQPLPPSIATREEWRAQLGLRPDAPVIAFIGRIDYKKRLPLLVEALALVENPATQLVVVGDGPASEKALVERAIVDHSLAARVHLTGWVEGADRVAAYRCADAFALLSDAENFGLAVFEALSVACPVVVSDQLALAPDLLAAGAARVVPQDPRLAARELDRILADPRAAAELGAHGERFVAQHFSRAVVAQALKEISNIGP